ncbi:MAG: TlpA family protein disulfide reductase [Bacteroidaceae bacterium]|nr:TlpA family protein disulfide reductase [Bacteroidaceae bacterium]
MKHTIITALLAVFCLTAVAQKTVVWKNPSAFIGESTGEFKITKVELKQTETVLHVHADYYPGGKFSFSKNSFLQTPDGSKYAITSGAKTSGEETDFPLDTFFEVPKSGKLNLALHFKPVPLDTKQMDFMEGYGERDFKFWDICDGKTKQKLVLPDDWKDVKYAKDETLPAAKINKGVATIKVKMLGYKPAMKMELHVGGFTPLGSRERFEKEFPFADDGTVKVEIPLWLTREVYVGIQGMAFSNIVVAPGQETSILMKVTSDNRPFVAFKGNLAKTNMDLSDADAKFDSFTDDDQTYLKVKDCNTPAERKKCLTDIFNQRISKIKSSKYTTAAKDLLCMGVEENYVKWTRNFAGVFCVYYVDEEGTVCQNYENYKEKYQKCKDMLPLTAEEKAYTCKYLDEPASPCSKAFWESLTLSNLTKNPYNYYLRDIPSLLGVGGKLQVVYAKHKDPVEGFLNGDAPEDCKDVIREYQAEQKRIAQELANKESVFYKKYDDVAPENILKTILDKYKGKTVVIDIWATWCGPCRAGHKAMKPMKEEMKGKNVLFVYITSPSSPLATWQEMIQDIDGDHYYLTKEQYNYILDKYESHGIPTYAIYDANGNQTYTIVGFPGAETFKEEINKALNK